MTGLFGDVIGHSGVIELLESEIDRPTQAYLFVGPQSVGKETVALRFAAGLLGGVSDERARRLALAASHPDLRVIEPKGRDQSRCRPGQGSGGTGIPRTRRGSSHRVLVPRCRSHDRVRR